jgi:hypothetical protein
MIELEAKGAAYVNQVAKQANADASYHLEQQVINNIGRMCHLCFQKSNQKGQNPINIECRPLTIIVDTSDTSDKYTGMVINEGWGNESYVGGTVSPGTLPPRVERPESMISEFGDGIPDAAFCIVDAD